MLSKLLKESLAPNYLQQTIIAKVKNKLKKLIEKNEDTCPSCLDKFTKTAQNYIRGEMKGLPVKSDEVSSQLTLLLLRDLMKEGSLKNETLELAFNMGRIQTIDDVFGLYSVKLDST